jgi:hypothetical protein
MRRGKVVRVVELPEAPPTEIVYVVTPGIPVEIPVLQPEKIETGKDLEKRITKEIKKKP